MVSIFLCLKKSVSQSSGVFATSFELLLLDVRGSLSRDLHPHIYPTGFQGAMFHRVFLVAQLLQVFFFQQNVLVPKSRVDFVSIAMFELLLCNN